MDRVTITNAMHSLEELLESLDNAYWEAGQMPHKDTIYDIISIIHIELNELAKLSVEDHYMAYEPVTAPFRTAWSKLKLLQSSMEEWVLRSRTAEKLETALRQVISLISNHG